MHKIGQEIASQPATWRQAAGLIDQARSSLPGIGARVAVIGCGTSHFIGQAFARAREAAGHGETDAFAASELPDRAYDVVLAISRSGETTELLWALRALPKNTATIAICARAGTPVAAAVDRAIVLGFADEQSVVQTRFATSSLALLRAHLGHDVEAAAADAEQALCAPLPFVPSNFDQFVFLGSGWTVGLAQEAALKLREAANAWTEAYPAYEYRHGPIATAGVRTMVWPLVDLDVGLAKEIGCTGATVIGTGGYDPMATLVLVQRTAVALAAARGLDPDNPKNLSRSVVLA